MMASYHDNLRVQQKHFLDLSMLQDVIQVLEDFLPSRTLMMFDGIMEVACSRREARTG